MKIIQRWFLSIIFITAGQFAAGQPADTLDRKLVSARTDNYETQLESYFRKYLVDEYETRAAKAWDRNYSSAEELIRSVAPNRRRWKEVLNPPALKKSGPLVRTPYPLAGIEADWIELPLGTISAQALLAFPDDATEKNPAPLVIVVHGMGGTPESLFLPGIYHAYAKALLAAGFAVLAPMNLEARDSRNNMERYARLAGTSLPGIELARIQHLLDIVLADRRVDAEKVGMWGLSLGGMATMFSMPLEPRIKVGVVSAWFADRRKKMAVADPRYGSFSPKAGHAFFNGWLTEFTDADVVSLIAPRPLMIQHGKKDRIAHWPDVVEEFEKSVVHYEKLNIPEAIELTLHEGGHETVVEDGVRFMSTWLKPKAGTQDVARPVRPNIIFIMADDLGYNDLGTYGQRQIRTPNLDQMAREGLRFTNFYAGSTVCAPSRCVLITGQHTGTAHVRGNRKGDEPLPDSVLTVAEVLKRAGYTTAVIGKWGLGDVGTEGSPTRQGFDYSFGYLTQRHAHNYYPHFLFQNDDRVDITNVVAGSPADGAGVAVKKEVYSHDLLMDEAIRFLERNKNSRFFLYLTPTLPHANNEGGSDGMEVPDQGIYSRRKWPEAEKNFAAMVSLLDDGVGKILSKLKELNIDKNTLVIFTSDNGPHDEGGHKHDFFDSNGPFRGKKRDLYEGGIRVPMIAWWPGKISGGEVTDHLGYLGDAMATAAELAGVPVPENKQSVSIVPILLGDPEQQVHHEFLYWEFYERTPQQAVRMGEWKAIRRPMFNGATELYNLREDEEEARNIAKAHPELVKRLEKKMEDAHRPSSLWGK